MRLTDAALTEFRAIWEEDHPGEHFSDEELTRMAMRVLRAVELVAPDGELSTPAA